MATCFNLGRIGDGQQQAWEAWCGLKEATATRALVSLA
jgi:hypothetical protein